MPRIFSFFAADKNNFKLGRSRARLGDEQEAIPKGQRWPGAHQAGKTGKKSHSPFFQGFKRSCHCCRAQLHFSQAGGCLDLSSRPSDYFNWNPWSEFPCQRPASQRRLICFCLFFRRGCIYYRKWMLRWVRKVQPSCVECGFVVFRDMLSFFLM